MPLRQTQKVQSRRSQLRMKIALMVQLVPVYRLQQLPLPHLQRLGTRRRSSLWCRLLYRYFIAGMQWALLKLLVLMVIEYTLQAVSVFCCCYCCCCSLTSSFCHLCLCWLNESSVVIVSCSLIYLYRHFLVWWCHNSLSMSVIYWYWLMIYARMLCEWWLVIVQSNSEILCSL